MPESYNNSTSKAQNKGFTIPVFESQVGAGGLGQLLSFHMGLFHMNKTATILLAMILLVALVDVASYVLRRVLTK